jgi:hypothetical protein
VGKYINTPSCNPGPLLNFSERSPAIISQYLPISSPLSNIFALLFNEFELCRPPISIRAVWTSPPQTLAKSSATFNLVKMSITGNLERESHQYLWFSLSRWWLPFSQYSQAVQQDSKYRSMSTCSLDILVPGSS